MNRLFDDSFSFNFPYLAPIKNTIIYPIRQQNLKCLF